MTNRFRRLQAILALALFVPSCSGLRDRDPFITDTVTLSKDPVTGAISIDPPVIYGNWSYGKVQINNTTGENHGFAIDDLAIYAEIPKDQAPIVSIGDARDDTTYMFYCHLHDPKGQEGTEYRGELIIDYAEEEGL